MSFVLNPAANTGTAPPIKKLQKDHLNARMVIIFHYMSTRPSLTPYPIPTQGKQINVIGIIDLRIILVIKFCPVESHW